ncbi:MAG: 50S ribosomal protein L15 [Candidatus Omnitrophota bacterium]
MQKKASPKKITPPAAKKRLTRKKEQKSQAIFGIHVLKPPAGSHKPKKLLGRGSSSGHGKTSTRGSKGQTSRAGRHFYVGFEGGQTPLIRRIPKRGFTSQFKKEYQIVNLRDLQSFKETNLTLELLEARGLIKNKQKLVKVLGDGEVTASLTVQAHAFSKKAADKIKALGGNVELIKKERG